MKRFTLDFLEEFGRSKRLKLLFVVMAGFLANCTGSAQSVVEKHGQLRVAGNRILDKDGNAVQLRGMSLYWSQWGPGKFYNYETVKWLRDDWRCTVVRAAMAVDEGGYATNPVAEINKVFVVVDAAIDLGIYVIIDFHAHEAQQHTVMAQNFFAEMAKKYGNSPNVIYETWNEPLNFSWSGVIKPYHEAVIDSIRKYDPDNIIVCGTRTWSQQVDEASQDPINKPNIAYTLHYYASTHKQSLRDNAQKALDRGVALFVTEYGTTEASGNGAVNETESRTWWKFLDDNKISHANWSVADLSETSAALHPGASATGGWTTSQIKPSGQLVRNELIAKYNASMNPAPVITGSLENLKENGEMIFPNPSDSSFQVRASGAFSYLIINHLGKVVEKGKGNNKSFVGAALQPGTYILKVQSGNKEKETKIIKQ